MKKFITVTLNPSLDRTLLTHYLAVGYHNRSEETSRLDPAGKGVNIARALNRLACYTHAIILLGNDITGSTYKALVSEEGFETTFIEVDGPTRSNTIIYDTGHNNETQISEEGPTITEDDVPRVLDTLKAAITKDDVVIFANPLPNGAPADIYARLIEATHQAGAEAIVATGETALREALQAQPEVVALQQIECEAFFNYPIRVQEDIISAAHKLRTMGAGKALIENPETNMAVWVNEQGEWEVELPAESRGTTSGVWDALLAGFLAGEALHRPLNKSLEMGAIAAAFTASQIGNEFGSPTEIRAHKPEVEVVQVESNNHEQVNNHKQVNR